MSKSRSTDYWLSGIIILAAFLRLFRIGSLTEFLGDQGRTMLIMRQFVEQGIVPLAGPTTLSGHHLGPFFYYLLLPGYLIGGNPLGVSVWMAILGVVAVILLYKTVRELFGIVPARLVAFLWAVSPNMVTADRIIWEPNLVPLFSVLFLFLLYRAYKRWLAVWWIALGATVGVLVQLHYPNLYFIGLVFLVVVAARYYRVASVRQIFSAAVWWVLGLCIVIAPFLWYEMTVGFRDITGIFGVLGEGTSVVMSKRTMVWQALDYSFRVWGKMLPWMSRWPALGLLGAWGIFLFFAPTRKNIFLTVWFLGGVTAMVRYSGVVHDHYLAFITPVPFLMLASVASRITHTIVRYGLIGTVIVIGSVHIFHTDIFNAGANDIGRTHAAVSQIAQLTKESPFSFTLLTSRSYSDLHYRYAMAVAGLVPLSVTRDESKFIILVCDTRQCPSAPDVTKLRDIEAMCYDEHCRGRYPTIELARDWSYIRDEEVNTAAGSEGRVYLFERKSERE